MLHRPIGILCHAPVWSRHLRINNSVLAMYYYADDFSRTFFLHRSENISSADEDMSLCENGRCFIDIPWDCVVAIVYL